MSANDILINTVVPALGVLISNMMFFSPWSLVMKARLNRHLGNINPIPFAIMFVTNLGFIVYGSLLSNYYIFFSSILGVIVSLFYCITCLTIMAKEASEDEFTELYIQVEGLVLFGIFFWGIMGIIQTTIFSSWGDDEREQANTFIGYLCCFFNICYYAAPLSTMATIIKTKDSSSLYLPNVLVNSVNATLWLSYGAFGVNNIVVWGPSLIGLLLSILQIMLVFIYHEGHWLEAVSGWITQRTIQKKTRIYDSYDDESQPPPNARSGSISSIALSGSPTMTRSRKASAPLGSPQLTRSRKMTFSIRPDDNNETPMKLRSMSKDSVTRSPLVPEL